MKAVLLTIAAVMLSSYVEATTGDDPTPIKTSIVNLAEEFAKNPDQAVIKYSERTPDKSQAVPMIEFSGNIIGYDGKFLFMHTESNVKVLVVCNELTGEKPVSNIISGVGRFQEYKDHAVYIIASKLTFKH